MTRYDEAHKQRTRRRVLDAAGRRLKTDGIDGSGVKTLMADAGLTNGAFYAHFDSKDDLVAATVADQLQAQRDLVDHLPDDPAALTAFLHAYLSVEHRDDRAAGCPSGALLSDLARSSRTVRGVYTGGVVEIADALAGRLPDGDRLTALRVLATLTGTLQLARSLDDPDLSAALLDSALTALTIQLTPTEDTP